MSLSTRALQTHGLHVGLIFSALVVLREPVVAANHLSQNDQKMLSSLQQRIEELDRAGKYREAIPVAQDALKLVESTMGSDGLETAAACDKLAGLYYKMGSYSKAEPLYQRALAVSEKIAGRDHPDTAKMISNLALLYAE